MSILPRLPACAVSTSPEPSVYKCGKCLRNPDWQVMFDHEPEKAVATRRRIYDMVSADKLLVSGYHFSDRDTVAASYFAWEKQWLLRRSN